MLPFTIGFEEQPSGLADADRVRQAIYAHLAPLPPRDVELARIDSALAAMSPAERRSYGRIGRALQCDTLLLGTVTAHRDRYLGLYSEIVRGAELELVRAADGEVLWRAGHLATSRGGGLPISPLGIIEGAVRALTNIGGEQLDRVTDDLARRLVRALPKLLVVPDEAVAAR